MKERTSRDLENKSGSVGGPIDVREFRLPDEFRELSGFTELGPVDDSTYSSIEGHYNFATNGPGVSCCHRRDNALLCGQEHWFGFVVRCRDNSVSIIGNCCAEKHFDVETSAFRKQRSRYIAAQRRNELLSALQSHTQLAGHKRASIAGLQAAISRICEATRALTDVLGYQATREMEQMARLGKDQIRIRAVTRRERQRPDGTIERERMAADYGLWRLAGLSVLLPERIIELRRECESVGTALVHGEGDLRDLRDSDLSRLLSKLNSLDGIIERVARLEQDYESFRLNDFRSLCFVLRDRAERYKLIRAASTILGASMGKDKAKEWLAKMESELCSRFGADSIEVI